MANYSDIRGYRVKYLSSDPTLNTSTEGQVWYNSTSGTLKSLVQIKAWSSGGNMGTARRGGAGGGTVTAGLAFGGASYTVPTTFNNTEEYSGYIWTAGGNMNTARGFLGGSGTQTAGLAFGGTPGSPNQAQVTTATEEYNGSTWASNPTGLNTTRRLLAGFGTQTATIAFGGDDASPGFLTNTESYDGSTWTSSPGSLASGIETGSNAGAGIQTAGITAGTNITYLLTQTWNGSAWASGPNLNNNQGGNNNLVGTQTSSLVFGGSSSLPSEQWDGSTWTSTPALGTQRRNTLGFGIATLGLAGGGLNPSNTMVTTTEEYNSNINAITKAAWSSGGNTNTSRYELGGTGILTAGLIAGGYLGPPGNTGAVEEYNGTSWSNQTSLNTSRRNLKGFGIQTAGTMAGGYTTGTSAVTENYNGTAWTNTGNLNTGRYGATASGTQTTGLIFGGSGGPTASEEFNGSTWTTGNSTNTGDRRGAAGGSQTATIYANRETSSAASTNVENYDGTSWTTGTATNIARVYNSGTGVQDDFLTIGGSPNTSSSEIWDGTTWSQNASLATGRGAAGSGTATSSTASGFVAAGDGSPLHTNATEEYTGGTATATASTLTTS